MKGASGRRGGEVIFLDCRRPSPGPSPAARVAAVVILGAALLFGVGLLSDALASWVHSGHQFRVAYFSPF